MIPTPEVPFSNGTEQNAWESVWCAYCTHDHGATHHQSCGDACDVLVYVDEHAGEETWRWPEAWLPEPDDGQFALPSRMICALFTPCHKEGCSGDPGAEARAERVAEVSAYWQSRGRNR